MTEYIKREALTIENLEKYMTVMEVNTKEYGQQVVVAVDDLMYLPAADVVEIVRCCECIHKQENPDINNTCFLTCNLSYGLQGVVDPTDFCSYGLRKEGANNG